MCANVMCVCVCVCVCVSTGGMLPVLAQQWHPDLWRVHSGATGRGESGWILSENIWSVQSQGKPSLTTSESVCDEWMAALRVTSPSK